MNEIMKNINRLSTTKLGIQRIKENLHLDTDDVVEWCKKTILEGNAIVDKVGKNWYVTVGKYKFTINSYSYSIITAHIAT